MRRAHSAAMDDALRPTMASAYEIASAAQRAGVFQVYDPEAAAGGEASWWAIAFDDEFRPSLIEIDAETMTQPPSSKFT